MNAEHLLTSLSLNSLSNVSIFENEEYFNYFHKLMQQFSFIDFNLKLNATSPPPSETPPPIKQTEPTQAQTTTTLPLTSFQQVLEYKPKPLAPLRKTSRSSSIKKSNTTNLATTLTLTPSASISSTISSIANYQNSSHTRSHSGFNLKNKIKSWFSNNNNNSNCGSNNGANLNTHNHQNSSPSNTSATNTIISSASSSNIQSTQCGTFSHCSTLRANRPTTFKSPAPLARGARNFLKPPNKNIRIEVSEQQMKHSTSEPSSVNEFLK